MGKRDRIKRVVRLSNQSYKKASASESASNTSCTILEPRLNEPADRVNGASLTRNHSSQNAPVRDLWGLALEKLSLENKEAISPIMSKPKLDILRHVHTAAVKKRTDCEAQQWKFELNGRQIVLRDIAEKIIVWIDIFKEIADIAVSFDQVHASLPWAGIRFLLEITVAESQQMGALLTGVEKVTSLIGRCQIYETLYLQRDKSKEEDWKQAVVNLTSALVPLYATILSFLGSAIRVYNQGAIIRTLRAILNPAEVIGFLDKCQTLDNDVAREAENCERIHSRQITRQTQTSSEERTQKLKQILEDFQTPILRVDSRPALVEHFKQLPNDEAFAYFYCDRNQSDRREPALILSSFVRQLSTSRTNDAIPRSTVQLYKQKQQTGFASGRLKLEESESVLAELFEIYPLVTLVVDALDECDKKTQLQFIAILDKLITQSSTPVKILISSRRDEDINRRFKHGPDLEIRAIDNRDDIAMFLNHEFSTSTKFWRVEISSELKELICSTLLDRSEGMFQWVATQIALLRDLCRERDIRNRLGKLPETLKTAYDELYLKIQSQEESAPMIANYAFQWVMCSCWPLSPAELVAAVCQDPDTNEIDEVDINISTVLDSCQNLLVVDQELNVCRFSHSSVQEYFENHHWSSGESDRLVGKVCLSLLINNLTKSKDGALPTNKEGGDKGTHKVLEYACLNWATHIQRLEEKGIVENSLTALLKRFLGSMDRSSLAYQNWHKMVGKHLHDFGSRQSRSYYELPSNMHYEALSPCSRASLAIVSFGFHKTLLDWWAVGFADVNEKTFYGSSLLMIGAARGFVSIAEDLLKKGADVNAASRGYGTALQAASYWGVEPIVQMLLDKGADVNASGGIFGNALQGTSNSGHKSIVQLLLDKGADVNASGGEYGSALKASSIHNHKAVMKLLQAAMKPNPT